MALRGVRQENYSGCFLAAIATLMGKTYDQVFSIFYPGQDQFSVYDHGFKEMSVENAAFNALSKVGIKAHRSNLKRFSSYAKRKQHALLIVRWSFQPSLCHTIVYDGEDHNFIDPSFGSIIRSQSKIQQLQDQLDVGIIIDQIPEEKNETQRSISHGLQLPQQRIAYPYHYEDPWYPNWSGRW